MIDAVIKKDILYVLSQTIDILKAKEEKDFKEIKNLSNYTIHNASIFQDEDSISIAILVYSLSKVIERRQEHLNYNDLLGLFNAASASLAGDDLDSYRKTINKIFKIISELDSKLRLYIEEVINQAQIKKGSKVYEHGISMAMAASILGVSQWELMSYVGKTNIAEMPLKEPVSVKTRLKFARSVFNY